MNSPLRAKTAALIGVRVNMEGGSFLTHNDVNACHVFSNFSCLNLMIFFIFVYVHPKNHCMCIQRNIISK